MRGARREGQGIIAMAGIIPADAGSTTDDGRRGFDCEDHPRRCGEHGLADLAEGPAEGSSPQMRGALPVCNVPFRRMRIIPADAGSTNDGTLTDAQLQDHPRRCGEHRRYVSGTGFVPGSSPQMRGALHCEN